MAADMIRLQMALAFGALGMQQRMVSGCWQMARWWVAAFPAPRSDALPARRRKAA